MKTEHSKLRNNLSKNAGRRFRFNWKMTLFTVALLPLLISLGQWQLDREQEKKAAQLLYENRMQETPVNLDELD